MTISTLLQTVKLATALALPTQANNGIRRTSPELIQNFHRNINNDINNIIVESVLINKRSLRSVNSIMKMVSTISKRDKELSPCKSKTEHLPTKSIICDNHQLNHFEHLQCMTITIQHSKHNYIGVGCELRFKREFRYKNRNEYG